MAIWCFIFSSRWLLLLLIELFTKVKHSVKQGKMARLKTVLEFLVRFRIAIEMYGSFIINGLYSSFIISLFSFICLIKLICCCMISITVQFHRIKKIKKLVMILIQIHLFWVYIYCFFFISTFPLYRLNMDSPKFWQLISWWVDYNL